MKIQIKSLQGISTIIMNVYKRKIFEINNSDIFSYKWY